MSEDNSKQTYKFKRDGLFIDLEEKYSQRMDVVQAIGLLSNMQQQYMKLTNDSLSIEKNKKILKERMDSLQSEVEFLKEGKMKSIEADMKFAVENMVVTKVQKLVNDIENPEIQAVGRHEIISSICQKHGITPDNPLVTDIRNIADKLIKPVSEQ